MVEVLKEQQRKTRCLLVCPPSKAGGTGDESRPRELESLAQTLGMEVAHTVVLARIVPTAAYGIGTGKAREVADIAHEVAADCIIFDWEVDPTKQRNWERLAGCPVLDRSEVIIRIFDQRAQTKEAHLQVELARLQYSLPRLAHMYGDLARQRGGAYGAKGTGETQLELDRRQVEERIAAIKDELLQVEATRKTQRNERQRSATATCALVGYTNAGKSSLLNALTGASVFVEDKLFATLDPTTRKLPLAAGSSVLLTDTVGFISNLPHALIKAFKSTLEEASLADFLLVVVDASDDDCQMQYEQVQKVLSEIGAGDVPYAVVINKMDLVQDEVRLSRFEEAFPSALRVSAKTHEGFEDVIRTLSENLLGKLRSFCIPLEQSSLVELVRKNGTIEREVWRETSVELAARVRGTLDGEGRATTRTLALLKDYIV